MINSRPRTEPLDRPSTNWSILAPIIGLGLVAICYMPIVLVMQNPKKDEGPKVTFSATKIHLVPEKPKEPTVRFRITHENEKLGIVRIPVVNRAQGAREIRGLWWEFQKTNPKDSRNFAEFLKSKGYELSDEDPITDVVVD